MHDLGRVIGENLRRLRAENGLSLDALAKESGVSKSRLSQIEQGEANPSISTIWQIASALKVGFSALVDHPQPDSVLVRGHDVEPVTADDGRYRVYLLFPFDAQKGFEVYRCELDSGGRAESAPHPAGTSETVIVQTGRLEVGVGDSMHYLGPGDALRFRADLPHTYGNPDGTTAVFSFVIAYPRTS